MDVKNKVIVITGGSSGLGAKTAQYLSERGAKIAILDVDYPNAQSVAAQVKGMAIACDVTDSNETEAALAQVTSQLGEVRIAICCAGIAPAKRVVGKDGPMPLQDFERVIRVNLIGTFNVLRLAAAIMAKLEPLGEAQERGVIINTASIAAFDGQIGQAAYSASKGGISALTLPAARELGDLNIRVMTIAPGVMYTPLLESLPEEVQTRLASTIPFPKRFGAPTEFAMLVEHIIVNTYLNGEVIRLDGALRMQAR